MGDMTFEELQALCAELDAVRPKTMTEGEVMRLASYAWKMGERLGEARGRADERAEIIADLKERDSPGRNAWMRSAYRWLERRSGGERGGEP